MIRDLENIVYKYLHNLYMKDVVEEIRQKTRLSTSFYDGINYCQLMIFNEFILKIIVIGCVLLT